MTSAAKAGTWGRTNTCDESLLIGTPLFVSYRRSELESQTSCEASGTAGEVQLASRDMHWLAPDTACREL